MKITILVNVFFPIVSRRDLCIISLPFVSVRHCLRSHALLSCWRRQVL